MHQSEESTNRNHARNRQVNNLVYGKTLYKNGKTTTRLSYTKKTTAYETKGARTSRKEKATYRTNILDFKIRRPTTHFLDRVDLARVEGRVDFDEAVVGGTETRSSSSSSMSITSADFTDFPFPFDLTVAGTETNACEVPTRRRPELPAPRGVRSIDSNRSETSQKRRRKTTHRHQDRPRSSPPQSPTRQEPPSRHPPSSPQLRLP